MSDAQTPKRGPGRPPKIGAVIPRAEESTWSTDDVLAKRLAGQPFGIKTSTIPLAEPGKWQLYIANSNVDESRHYNMVFTHGWVPVTVEDLQPGVVPESVGLRVNEAGALCRGARGDEVLYKMPKAIYDQLQKAKAAKNVEGMGSAKKAREDAAVAAAAAHGDEAADYIYKHANITVKDTQQSGV